VNKSWPEATVAKRDPYTGKLTIDGIEVVFDPLDRVYVPREKIERTTKVGEPRIYDV